MMKRNKIMLALFLIVAVVASSLGVYALATFTFRQTLTVPPEYAMSVWQADGITPIASMEDISSQWTWTGSQFIAHIVVSNIGNAPFAPQFKTSSGNLVGWTFIFGGNNSIPIGDFDNCSMVAIPPNTVAGTSTSDFDITVSAGP